MTSTQREQVVVRAAKPGDVRAIRNLYELAYGGPNVGPAENHYPFAQFLDESWLAAAVSDSNLCWFVAEVCSEIGGSIGAVRNIGNDSDQVAEGFGLVVRSSLRGRGIGFRLFDRLCQDLEATAQFIIAETRTADPGGLRVVRRRNFAPLGFEPFAHVTPVGPESMLLNGWLCANARRARDLSCTSSLAVHKLAEVVLGPQNLRRLTPMDPPDRSARSKSIVSCDHRSERRKESSQASQVLRNPDANALHVARDDREGRSFLERWPQDALHGSGVVSLRRLEGEDRSGHRYDRRFFVATIRGAQVAAARLVRDHVDHRVRILELQSHADHIRIPMLRCIIKELMQETEGAPNVIVIDIRADSPEIHEELESLGFFPTVYYPALISVGSVRRDAVQYTLVVGSDVEEQMVPPSIRDWPAALAVVETVTAAGRQYVSRCRSKVN